MTHTFDTDIAAKYGIKAAVVFQNLVFWCQHSEANGTNFHDGYYWTYNTTQAFREIFPYLSTDQIRLALKKLLDDGVIIKGHYSSNAYDRTTWYAVTERGKSILPKQKNHLGKKPNGNLQKTKSSITDINTDIKPIVIESDDNANSNVTECNPYSDHDEPIDLNTVEAYVSSNIDRLSPGNMEELESYKEDLPDELIRYAVDEAVANSVRSWAYVRKILNAILDKGFKTVGEAKAAADRKRQQKAPQPQYDDTNPALRAKFY